MTNTARKLHVPACAKARQTTIPIGKDFRLVADVYCWTLQRRGGVRKNRRSGTREQNWRAIGYFPTLEAAIPYLAEYRLRVSGIQNLAEALAECERISWDLRRALHG